MTHRPAACNTVRLIKHACVWEAEWIKITDETEAGMDGLITGQSEKLYKETVLFSSLCPFSFF